MREISATDAARGFSELLDTVEHDGESFVVIRRGRAVARVVPSEAANGRGIRELLLGAPADPEWAEAIAATRSLLVEEDRAWDG